MKVIVISFPLTIEKEHEILDSLFEKGLETFHLRKPDSNQEEMEGYIKKIQPKYISRIMIHSHYSLLGKYNLKGIHLPEKIRKSEDAKIILKTARSRRLTVSTSAHEMEEIKNCKGFDYAFLSPVYTSISKPAYPGSIDPGKFKSWKESNTINTKVIALGGVELKHVEELQKATFDGIALLGAIWKSHDGIESFSEIKSEIDKE